MGKEWCQGGWGGQAREQGAQVGAWPEPGTEQLPLGSLQQQVLLARTQLPLHLCQRHNLKC